MPSKLLHEDDQFIITKVVARGKRASSGYRIIKKGEPSQRMKLKGNEFFHLADILDDLCDEIEDANRQREEAQKLGPCPKCGNLPEAGATLETPCWNCQFVRT